MIADASNQAPRVEEPRWAPGARLVMALLLLLALATALPAAARPPHGPPHGPRLGAMIERHADELGLDDAARDAIREIVEASHADGEALREEIDEAKARLHELMEQDEVDRDRVLDQVERVGELRTESKKHRIGTLLDIRALLTPEQRRALAERRKAFGGHFFGRIREACEHELNEQCPKPGPRAFHCLHRHRDALSEGCSEAIDDVFERHHGRGHGPPPETGAHE